MSEQATGGAVGLIARLEKATGPDRDLDLAIANSSIDDGKPWFFFDAPKEQVTRRMYGPGAVGNPVCGLEHFTRYTEDAAEIVPAGLDWSVQSTADGAFATVLTPDATEHEGVADTPAIALCIAALRALTATSQDTPAPSSPPSPTDTARPSAHPASPQATTTGD